MQTRLLTHFPSLALAVLFIMLVGSVGADDRKDDRKLEGTWDVILQFDEETCNNKPKCNCPGNEANIQIPALNTFLKGRGMLWSGSALAVVTGRGG
jgi:hypothetical protein